ncbi:MAG: hypothetical protein IPG82_19550 [Saprospiraceae bacterium]|nr:hypothetical protein [Saprospiraceae bacterium]
MFQDQGISFDRYENQGDQPILLDAQLRKDRIQFFFGLEGTTRLHFGPYIRSIDSENITFLFNPLQEHNFQIEITPNTKLITLFIPLEKLHKLFTTEDLPILSSDHIQQRSIRTSPCISLSCLLYCLYIKSKSIRPSSIPIIMASSWKW